MKPSHGTTTTPPRPSPAALAKLINASSRSDRRSSSRRPPRGNVTIEARKGRLGLGRNVAVLSLDLSEGGICLVLDHELERGAEVEVRISAYGLRQPLKVLGTVRWVMPIVADYLCIGIQFDERLSRSDLSTLSKS